MENASKALLMAAGVLIALIVIGALILMFNNLSTYQNTEEQNTKEAQIVKFNNQFETYIRDDVRGSDIYSLVNKINDYNSRQANTTGSKEGKDLQYNSITINVEFKDATDRKNLSYDNNNRVFTTNSYSASDTRNPIKDIVDKMTMLEDKYGRTGFANLSTSISIGNLFGKTSDYDKEKAVKLWNSNSDIKVGKYDDLNGFKTDVYSYYEYSQFKKLHFDCIQSRCKYNTNTGRLEQMAFKSNGKIE